MEISRHKEQIINLPLANDDYFEIFNKDNAVNFRSGLVTLEPGKEVGSHNTEDYEECIIVLEGEGEIETEGAGRRPISHGQVGYNPPHTQHNVINTGNRKMKYIYLVVKTI